MGRKLQLFGAVAATVLAALGLWLHLRPEPAAAANFELAMVIKETTNPYYNATLKGAAIAAGEIGGTVKNYGPTQSSPQAQIDIINNLADRHVPAIAIAPSDPDAVVPAMKRAERLGAKAPSTLTPRLRIAAFRDETKKYPNIKIVDEVYGYDNEQKAFDLTVALTTKYPNLGGIYAPTCPGLPAVARALESVNKGRGVIKLAGLCVPSITAKYMLDGTIQVFYLWDPVKLGYITFYAAKYFAEGKIHGEPGDSFTIKAGKWPGTYTIQSNHEIVTGQPLQFTAANIKENDY